ncbi:MAG: inorganic diphosphatase [Deltaproteobacteria bacterium]|nr:inorganic diphosphatase [Deltaproteobacteria bacterium]
MLGTVVRVRVEVPRGGRVKRGPTGAVELVSPVGCPFDYGAIPALHAADGDPADAVILGPPRRAGEDALLVVHGVVHFRDRGIADDKWVCGDVPTEAEKRRILRFFRWYARLKTLRRPWRPSAVLGTTWHERP